MFRRRTSRAALSKLSSSGAFVPSGDIPPLLANPSTCIPDHLPLTGFVQRCDAIDLELTAVLELLQLRLPEIVDGSDAENGHHTPLLHL